MTSPYFAAAVRFVHEHLSTRDVAAAQQRYRFQHCLRVAAIGRAVAEEAGMDADTLELACVLHDVGKFDPAWHVDHGRAGAKLARRFLAEQGAHPALIDEICQGIAMHTDGRWNYPPQSPDYTGAIDYSEEPSVLARSVGDCDNVDRFGAYRVYDTLQYVDFLGMELNEQLSFIAGYRQRLAREREYACATGACQRRWIEALDAQNEYFAALEAQIAAALPGTLLLREQKG
ncbi:HD domain-containing protein [Actinobaculum sp. 352]|uniref:HD domain-containing protein n=1 Tax=Actinobaculum sp. 352 TaxID=2490946 RepID=UPI000F7DF92C|nr:HD domain-containing protein [Actinobaculum sp. 352]RTE49824.1 HD domain-containing protein [Actinobaculum sp. 352]